MCKGNILLVYYSTLYSLQFNIQHDFILKKLSFGLQRNRTWDHKLIPVISFVSLSASKLVVATVKPVLSSHSKIDKSKVLKTNVSLMNVKSIAECSLGAFCNTFDLH